MIACLMLMTSILSTKIDNFMTLPEWMPTYVGSEDTFGSDEHALGTHRVTTNTLAAVESVFDAYYERIYFQSAAGVNDGMWNTNSFGPRGFKGMSFSLGAVDVSPMLYRNGNRTVPDTRRMVEFPELFRFSTEHAFRNLIDSMSPMLMRDKWCDEGNYKTVWMSSSLMPNARLPSTFEWSSSVPGNFNYLDSLPLIACVNDGDFHSYDINVVQLPVPSMFANLDMQYYTYVVYPSLPSMPATSLTVPDVIRRGFSEANPESGINDLSRRMKPDDYIEDETNKSSLIATVSRSLAIMNRTFEIPYLEKNAGVISNVTEKAKNKYSVTYSGKLRANDLRFDQSDAGNGTWTSDAFSDNDLTISSSSSELTNYVERGSVVGAFRDKVRFCGTGTVIKGQDLIVDGGKWQQATTVESLISEGQMFEDDTYVPGTEGYHWMIPEIHYEGGTMYLEIEGYDERIGWFGLYWNATIPQPVDLDVNMSVSIERSAELKRTLPITVLAAKDLIPFPVPCHSAFSANDMRVSSSHVSLLSLAFMHAYSQGHDSLEIDTDMTFYNPLPVFVTNQTVAVKMGERQITSSEAMRSQAYLSARSETSAKIANMVNAAVPGTANLITTVNQVNHNYLNNDQKGMRVMIQDGTFGATIRIAGVGIDKIGLCHLSEQEGKLFIDELYYYDEDYEMWTFFYPTDLVLTHYTFFSANNTGIGYSLSETAKDIPAVDADAMTVPMVTTDWNWKALKME